MECVDQVNIYLRSTSAKTGLAAAFPADRRPAVREALNCLSSAAQRGFALLYVEVLRPRLFDPLYHLTSTLQIRRTYQMVTGVCPKLHMRG